MIRVGEQGIFISDTAAKKLSPYNLSQFKKTLVLDLNALQAFTESDPIFQAWLATPPSVSIFTNDAGYLTSFTETDPIYTASSWYSTTNNSSNWNTAFGWGNHASVGYLTSITSGQVTAALGYTPYDATNPSGYITSSSLSSYVPTARTLTINGTTYDLSSNRSWTVSGGLSSLTSIGSSSNANGATISGSTLNLEPASASFGGVVTTSTQTFSGRKTFDGYITISAGTATAGTSPLKFTSGTNLTTAEAGAMEYNGTSLYFTRSGTLRAGILMTDLATPFNTYTQSSKGATAFTSGTDNFLGGQLAGASLTSGSQNVLIGTQAGNLSNAGLLNAVFIGYFAGQSASGLATGSVFIGSQAGQNSAGATNSVFIGQLSGFSSLATNATFIGNTAGQFATNAVDTIGIGQNAARNATGSVESIYMGKNSGYNAVSTGITGDYNIALGTDTAKALTTGAGNTFIGYKVGDTVTTGSKNLLLGYDIDAQSNTADGQLSIQNAIFGTGNIGTGTTASTGNVGIYTPAPSARLHLPAGTTTVNTAPLKLTSGTNLTTPENGAFEFDGTNLYFTVGGVRKIVTLT